MMDKNLGRTTNKEVLQGYNHKILSPEKLLN